MIDILMGPIRRRRCGFRYCARLRARTFELSPRPVGWEGPVYIRNLGRIGLIPAFAVSIIFGCRSPRGQTHAVAKAARYPIGRGAADRLRLPSAGPFSRSTTHLSSRKPG